MLLNPEGQPIQDAENVPPLTEKQNEEAEERTSVSAIVVHEAIRKDGDEELQRSASALAWSGLAAGLLMGFSFVAEGLLRAHLPDEPWRPLVVNLGYPLGFLMVIIGRQQLFTENTLTAIIPLLARRNWVTFLSVMRLWAIVLATNLCGAHIFAWVIARSEVLHPEVQLALLGLGREALNVSFGNAILRGIFAGWLIASVVWMNAATDSGRFTIIVTLTYVVGLGGLTHIVAGAVEVLYVAMTGERSWISVMTGYIVPTFLGNVAGGVSLVSALNHAQVVAGMRKSPAKA
ncbi:MAG TPA: formate/nitrite transporter family protein [Bryobacteraceae bacterium]|nr:formate/nitrite transporter family protein [Bryobacteraceae bacterium]